MAQRLATYLAIDEVSEHPLAHVIVADARRRGLAPDKPESFDSSVGVGGNVRGRRSALGNTALMESGKVGWKVLRRGGELAQRGRA